MASRQLSPEQIRYQEERKHENKGPMILVADSALIAVAVVVVILRFVARAMTKAGYKADDYTIVGALVRIVSGYSVSPASMLIRG